MIKLKGLLTEGKKNAKDLKNGDVFIKDVGYGKATYLVNTSIKQSTQYKNEWHALCTVVVPGKKNPGKYNQKYDELHVTFAPKYGKFSNVEYIGKWNEVKHNYQ